MAKIILTAQNIDVYDGDGFDAFARTGATTVQQISNAGASGCILGHPEAGDLPHLVHKKLLTICNKNSTDTHLLNNTLIVGETWDEFQNNSQEKIADIVNNHLLTILEDIPKEYVQNIVIGYDPKWGSRGSGHDNEPPPSTDLISIVCQKIHSTLLEMNCENVPIIYGGRSTPERTKEILAEDNVEGLILGSACNRVLKTMEIASVMAKVRPNKRKILHANFKAYDLEDSYQNYLYALNKLDDTFVVYMSPCYTDLREIAKLL